VELHESNFTRDREGGRISDIIAGSAITRTTTGCDGGIVYYDSYPSYIMSNSNLAYDYVRKDV